jgi:hypothetical protein
MVAKIPRSSLVSSWVENSGSPLVGFLQIAEARQRIESARPSAQELVIPPPIQPCAGGRSSHSNDFGRSQLGAVASKFLDSINPRDSPLA